MTFDEAIAKHRKIAETQKMLYDACTLKECNKHFLRQAEEHEQLAEWLEELKAYKAIGTVEECKNSVLDIQKAYNKAIDDFVHKCDKHCGFYSGKNKNITREDILKIAEQLKE